ncbi:Rpn family recombination-promoting nuclease/putative transposase [Microcystis aeruginosa]|nr:Rpn family recombination-promoting nuclease/putative transposase [Microcystis aeruginosa]
METILIYKLPKLNRKEIEKMFSLSDLSSRAKLIS